MQHAQLFSEQRQAMDQISMIIQRQLDVEDSGLPRIAALVPPSYDPVSGVGVSGGNGDG